MFASRQLMCLVFLFVCPFALAKEPVAEPGKGKPPAETADAQAPPAKPRPVSETARDILSKADAALKKIKTVKYDLRVLRIDVPEEAASVMSGPVILLGWNGQTPERFRLEVTTRPAGRDEEATVVVGSDTEQFWALNMRDKKAFTGDKLSSVGPYQALVQFFPVLEFVLPEPLGDELRGQSIQDLGQAVIGGEECHKIRVAYSSSSQSVTWYLSTKDNLPRRVDRVFVDPAGDTATRASFISNIVVDPELPDDVFTMVIPDEFVKKEGSWP